MRKLDFISGAPQLSIFKEGSNQTNLGGILYFIYLIILILLAIIYFADYFGNDKYEFNYTLVKESYEKIEESKSQKNEHLNYDIEFMFKLGIDNESTPLESENFIIWDCNKEEIIREGETKTINTENFQIAVMYICDGKNCTIREEDKIKVRSYYLNMYYKGYSLQHQDSEAPIKKLDEYIPKHIQFLSNTNIVYLNWEYIEYEEEQSIFSKTFNKIKGIDNTYYGGDFESMEVFTDDGHVKTLFDFKYDENDAIILLLLEIHPNQFQHDKYTRKKNSWLDVLADVSALSSTVLDLMALAYGFLYSQNYDNYKIIENIISQKMRINIDNKIEDKEELKIEFNSGLLDSNEEEDKEKEKIDLEKKLNDDLPKKGTIYLPFMRFYDFLFHQFYFKCCFGPSNKQTFIDSCNGVVAKYLSVENLLYNQIRLENLLKDYKWNNPQYDTQEKNDFLLELKEQSQEKNDLLLDLKEQ